MNPQSLALLTRAAMIVALSMVVHFWLVLASRIFPDAIAFGDLSLYNYWIFMVENGSGVYGFQIDWIYPALAIVPMLIASILSPENFELGWLTLVFFLNTLAAVLLLDRRPKTNSFIALAPALGFLFGIALLGPVAISRIDSISASLAILALVAIRSSAHGTATVLLTIAAWIKVWPIAMFLALLAATKNRLRVIIAAASTTIPILIAGLVVGGLSVFSFVFQQQGRGIQIESVYATIWLWLAKFGQAEIYFDEEVITNQVRGLGVTELSSISNLVMFIALSITFILALRAASRGRDFKEVFVVGSLTGVLDLIVFNKVGSPQFMIWILVPLIAAIYFRIPRLLFPLVVGSAILLLTFFVYPVFYLGLLALEGGPLALLTTRNLLLVALLVWGNLRLSSQKALK